MANIIEPGKHCKESEHVIDSSILIKCPECGENISVYRYECFELGLEAWCICGCKFIPDESDIIQENI